MHLKASSYRQIIALFYEIRVAESNDDVRILTESLEVAVSVDTQYKFGKKRPRTTGATWGGNRLQDTGFFTILVLFRACVSML